MSELKEIAVVLFKHLSDALLSAASELSKQNSITVNSKRELVSLEVGVHVVFQLKEGKRFGGKVKKIDGDTIEVHNEPMGKSWVTPISSIVSISKGEFYYKQ